MTAPKILIVFYSRNGSTEALAKAIAEGAENAGGEVRLRRAREIVSAEVMAKAPGWTEKATEMNERYPMPTEEDAEWADAIIFGTPTRFGSVTSELKAYIDGLGGLWFAGKLNGKVGSVFGSTSSTHGGNESTLLSLYNPMAHLGLIIVPWATPTRRCSRQVHRMEPRTCPSTIPFHRTPKNSKSHASRVGALRLWRSASPRVPRRSSINTQTSAGSDGWPHFCLPPAEMAAASRSHAYEKDRLSFLRALDAFGWVCNPHRKRRAAAVNRSRHSG